jgi:hypothetical protein
MKEHFKKWFNSLPAGDHPKDGEEWAWEAWQAALESRVLAERKPIYQGRTIGTTSWTDQSKDGFDHMNKYAAFETRILYAHPTPDDASADTARLDWLEQEDEMGFFYNIDHITANINEGFNGCKTLREAIDAAIDRARQSGEEGK